MATDMDALIASVLQERDSAQPNDPETPVAEAPVEDTDEVSLEVTGDEDTPSDEEVDETDEEPSDEDAEPAEGEVVVSDDTVLVLADGTKVSVKDGIELKAAFTRKTQELSEERAKVEDFHAQVNETWEEMRAWSESVQANPAAFFAHTLTQSSDPVTTLVDAIVEAATVFDGDPTGVASALLKGLNDGGHLAADFVQTFGLTKPEHPVNRKADTATQAARLKKLEEQAEARRQEEARTQQERQFQAEYDRQVSDIVREEGLTFANDAEFEEFRMELFRTAVESGAVDNLRPAYATIALRKLREDQAKQTRQQKQAAKKRPARAVSKGGASNGSKQASPPRAKGDINAAAAEAFAEFTAKRNQL